MLDDLGLAETIKYHLREYQERTGIRCNLTLREQDINLGRSPSGSIFRVFQETLTNVTSYAKATEVDVTLKKESGKLKLEVRDNGRGITESEISDPMSLGLSGMRERALLLGGELKIEGACGKGLR